MVIFHSFRKYRDEFFVLVDSFLKVMNNVWCIGVKYGGGFGVDSVSKIDF